MAKTKPKEQEKTNDLKHLDFKATEFMAMGKKYFVKLEPRMHQGMSKRLQSILHLIDYLC